MREFLHNCKRVLRVARKPDKAEYKQVSKVTLLGVLLVGIIGFVIMLIAHELGVTI